MKRHALTLSALIVFAMVTMAVSGDSILSNKNYWNAGTPLVSYRLSPPPPGYVPRWIDVDKDGDPDIIYSITVRNTPILWIDDDDDMKTGDLEGDTDSDCLLIDVNKDGNYHGFEDVAVDWVDTDNDGKADMQVYVEYPGEGKSRGGHYMWVIDEDRDNVFNYIDWNTFELRAWLHEGNSNFLEDYMGKSTFLKAHAPTYSINDIRLNWENPFLFFDPDQDGHTEMAFRALDTPKNRNENFVEGIISYVAVAYDMDNDNGAGNQLDYDMAFRFTGKGFNYMDQVHKFNNKRLLEADTFFTDPRWRQVSELIYPDHLTALDLTYQKGDWQEIYFVYDEDDDCERWERVEFYEPLNPFKTGGRNGGLDNNLQADAIGDRGEWDLDNSGKANIYLSDFDGRIHLFGAEWGCWRIDQLAFSYQAWGGLYDNYQTKWERAQNEFSPFSTIKYEDTDGNGFFDIINMDIDGDTIFEKIVSLKSLGLNDACKVIQTSKMNYEDYRKLHTSMSEKIWKRAEMALEVAQKFEVNTSWYAFMKHPKSEGEKYRYGYWLQLYIYMDLVDLSQRGSVDLKMEKIDRAYFGGNWDSLLK